MTHNNYNDLELEIYYGVSGLNSIESDWNRLVNEVNNKRYYHYYEWYDSYINSLEHEPESVLFCVFRNATNVVAIVPLKRTEWRFSAFSLTVLEIPSHPHLPLRDIVFPECYQSESITKSILNILKKSDRLDWDIINLSGLLEDSLAAKSFGNCQSRNISEDVKYNAYLKISPCETVFKTISSSMRNNLKRLRKKINAEGEYSFETIRTFPEIEAAYDNFLELEACGWKGADGTNSAIKCHQDLMAFYSNILKNFYKYGSQINLIKLNDLPISASIELPIGSTKYCLKIGTDENYRHLGPGILHIEDLVINSCKEGFEYLNFISNASWLNRWRVTKKAVKHIILFNTGIKSTLAFYLMKLQRVFSPLYYYKVKPFIRYCRSKKYLE